VFMNVNATPISIRNVSKTYDDGTQALKPTNLEIGAGEIVALLGPSGCGKTTLLRSIAGLETPDVGGSVVFGNEQVLDLPPEKRHIGMVFQHYALFPTMNVAANVAYGLKVRGISVADRKARVDELLETVRLSSYAQKRVQELSGGQRQRVALARAIAPRPKVLLLDEPLTALDAKLKESLRDELAELLRQFGITAIHVTHDQQEAMAIADRLAVMNRGIIEQVADARTLYEKPVTTFVAEFLGQVNVLAQDTLKHIGLASSATALYVRPEHVNVCAHDAAELVGNVRRVLYQGDRQRVWIDINGKQSVKANISSSESIQVGQSVGLSFPRDHLFSL
jgi:putative spermidine/putrescine transport system ATP-binding protein